MSETNKRDTGEGVWGRVASATGRHTLRTPGWGSDESLQLGREGSGWWTSGPWVVPGSLWGVQS